MTFVIPVFNYVQGTHPTKFRRTLESWKCHESLASKNYMSLVLPACPRSIFMRYERYLKITSALWSSEDIEAVSSSLYGLKPTSKFRGLQKLSYGKAIDHHITHTLKSMLSAYGLTVLDYTFIPEDIAEHSGYSSLYRSYIAISRDLYKDPSEDLLFVSSVFSDALIDFLKGSA